MRIAEQELYHACQILFGPNLQVTHDFLEYLQFSGIKSAFRKRALETHPDRTAGLDELAQCRSAALFRDVREAYEKLTLFLEDREKGYRLPPPSPESRRRAPESRSAFKANRQQNPRSASRTRPGANEANTAGKRADRQPLRPSGVEKYYQGPLPERRLLLGHFLYYSGVITWRMIIQALVWQRTQRPRLGELGRRYGWLTELDVLHILQQREFNQPFGQAALRLGMLNERQLHILVHQQKRLQKKFGQYFLEKQLLSPEIFAELLVRYHRHNSRMAAAWRYGQPF